jgi:hypothetical protein
LIDTITFHECPRECRKVLYIIYYQSYPFKVSQHSSDLEVLEKVVKIYWINKCNPLLFPRKKREEDKENEDAKTEKV